MPPDCPATAAPPPATRSRVTNNPAAFLQGVDGRSALARRFRDVLAELVSDMGGVEVTSEGERQLARRAATLSVMAEQTEAAWAAGDEVDTDTYVVITNALGRALGRIGLRRRARNVTPDLRSYLAAKAQTND